MPKGKNQKFKLYRLAQIMLENTDEEHYIMMPEIKEKLEEYEVTADRKSIYNDLKDLEKLGIEVEGEPVGNRYHYHVVERPFELPELKLLVDAIQSSKFITQKKTNTLIKKLEKLVSKQWYENGDLPLKKFFNTSGMLYKEQKLKDKLPDMSEEEQLRLLATNGMLVKRPLIVKENLVLTGFKEKEWTEKLL